MDDYHLSIDEAFNYKIEKKPITNAWKLSEVPGTMKPTIFQAVYKLWVFSLVVRLHAVCQWDLGLNLIILDQSGRWILDAIGLGQLLKINWKPYYGLTQALWRKLGWWNHSEAKDNWWQLQLQVFNSVFFFFTGTILSWKAQSTLLFNS